METVLFWAVVSTHVAEGPQTPVFDPYKELEVMMEKAETHAHAWGQTREILYGDVWLTGPSAGAGRSVWSTPDAARPATKSGCRPKPHKGRFLTLRSKPMPWESRFRVCDPVCGLVDVYPNKSEAMARAKKHAMECDSVTVYDLMAKRGAANNWNVRGEMIGFRPWETSL